MLISPAEPPALKVIGTVSSLPERYGADFLLATKLGMVGIQRKEVKDLVGSVRDGRLFKELVQLEGCAVGVFVVEGDWQWSTSGESRRVPGFTIQQWRGLTFSIASKGFWTHTTSSMTETIDFIFQLEKWFLKEGHTSLSHRANPQNSWGKPTNKDWACWLLQSFEGIGPKQAAAIYDHFGGLPLRWTCGVEDLMSVKGIGPKRAKALLGVLGAKEGNGGEV